MKERTNMPKNELAKYADEVLQHVPEEHRRRGVAAGVGAAVCGIVGSVLGGPIGAAVGASVGSAIAVAASEKNRSGSTR